MRVVKQFSGTSRTPIVSIDINTAKNLIAVAQLVKNDKGSILTLLDATTGKTVSIIESGIGSSLGVHKVSFIPHSDELIYVLKTTAGFEIKAHNFITNRSILITKTTEHVAPMGLSVGTESFVISGQQIRFFNARTFEELHSLALPISNLVGVDGNITICGGISIDDLYCAVGGVEKGKISLYHAKEAKSPRSFSGPFLATKRLEFNFNQTLLANLDFYGGSTIIWDVATGSRHLDEIFNEQMAAVFTICFSPISNLLALGLVTSTVNLYDMVTGRKLYRERLHEGRVYDLKFSNDGKLLVSAGEDNQIIIREVDL